MEVEGGEGASEKGGYGGSRNIIVEVDLTEGEVTKNLSAVLGMEVEGGSYEGEREGGGGFCW